MKQFFNKHQSRLAKISSYGSLLSCQSFPRPQAMQTLLTDFTTSKPWVCRPFFVLTLIPRLALHTPACAVVIIIHLNFPQHICIRCCNLRSIFVCGCFRMAILSVPWPRGFPASPSIMRSAELRSGWSRVHHAVADGSRSNFGAPQLLPTTNQPASAQSWILISCHVINKFHIWHVTSRKFKRKTTLIGWTKWRYVLCTIYGHDVQEIPDRLMHRKTGFPQ